MIEIDEGSDDPQIIEEEDKHIHADDFDEDGFSSLPTK